MPPTVKILSVSYDPILLTTRNAVLRHAGYEVLPAMSKAEAAAIISGQRFDLVLVGHGIPDQDRNDIAAAARSGTARSLMMYNPGDDLHALRADAFVDASNGPRELLRAVAAILGPNGKAFAAGR